MDQRHPWVGIEEGTLEVRELRAPVVPEPPREGEGDRPECGSCRAEPDAWEVYRDELWRVRALREMPFPGTLMLSPLRHVDGMRGLDDRELASYGPLVARVERALLALPAELGFRGAPVARVHAHQWNDGGAHLHQWFFPRPLGYLDLLGSTLVEWLDVLPPAPEAALLAAAEDLRERLR